MTFTFDQDGWIDWSWIGGRWQVSGRDWCQGSKRALPSPAAGDGWQVLRDEVHKTADERFWD
jgi:hypothetical protein